VRREVSVGLLSFFRGVARRFLEGVGLLGFFCDSAGGAPEEEEVAIALTRESARLALSGLSVVLFFVSGCSEDNWGAEAVADLPVDAFFSFVVVLAILLVSCVVVVDDCEARRCILTGGAAVRSGVSSSSESKSTTTSGGVSFFVVRGGSDFFLGVSLVFLGLLLMGTLICNLMDGG
jgi:hypothetical protein